MKLPASLLLLAIVSASVASAQKLNVKIIDRRDNQTSYAYVVPSHYSSYSNANADCGAYGNSANCSGSSTTIGYTTPGYVGSFTVSGATLSLLLPDGRIVVVNCKSKFAERFRGPAGNHRSCRVPIVDNIRAYFHGDKAKLSWPVSLDEKKWRSETYKILGIFGKPKQTHKR